MADEQRLNENFLTELFRLCLKKKEIIDICKKVLKYQYLPNAEYKEIWKQIQREYDLTNTIPSVGVLYERCKGKDKVINLLEDIKNTEEPNERQIVRALENFIKDSICIDFYDNFQDLYVKDKRDKAIELLYETSQKLNTFSLNSEYVFSSVFKDFRDRQYDRKIEKAIRSEEEDYIRVSPIYGIDELDALYPPDENDCVLFAAQSGVGKTTYFIHSAIENARRGLKVLFITGEGTKREMEERFDACWTARQRMDIKNANLTDEEIAKLSQTAEKITALGGDIFFYVFEEFGTPSLLDVLGLIQDFIKKYGCPPDLLLLDYLELFNPSKGNFSVGELKERMQALAREVNNLTKATGIRLTITASQCSDVDKNLLNSEEFVLTRNDLKGDKNLIDAFSLFWTLNQTDVEYDNDTMRIAVDKTRHSSKKVKKIIHIATDYENGRFYNRKRTLQEFATTLT